MLYNASGLIGYAINASDGAIGEVADFLFDDHAWTCRWAVVDTGGWFGGRQVLLPLKSAVSPDVAARALNVEITRDQVKNSPGVDTRLPVSRQNEQSLLDFYGGEPYWPGFPAYPSAAIARPLPDPQPARPPEEIERERMAGDPDLRSTGEVTGYYLEAEDGEIGHIEEFLLDAEAWAIRYVVVDTKNWWPGKKTLILPGALSQIDWAGRSALVSLTREQIRNGPEYDPGKTVDRAYEQHFHDYYQYAPYWI
jgi:hypothetical protein